MNGALKIVFIPNYDVQTAQDLIPAADLSEQISTAGTEASGTGNMKFALNGALTIATHDGANDEIAEAVGSENMFMFGNTVEELSHLRAPATILTAIYELNGELKRVLNMIRDGYFSPEQRNLFVPIFNSLVRQGDHYMVLADYEAYVACQANVDAAFKDQKEWTRKTIHERRQCRPLLGRPAGAAICIRRLEREADLRRQQRLSGTPAPVCGADAA